MTIQLRAHNAWDALIGTLETPNEPAETADEPAKVAYKNLLQSVNKIEYTAQNLIVCSLSTQVRQLINMCSSSREMWDKLLSIFEKRTGQRQDRLFNKFFGIKEEDPLESVAKHMAKLEKFWVELQDETWKEDKVKLPESLFMNRVLNTLPKEYFEFLNAWESVAKQQRTIQLLRERLCTVEMRLQEREENSDLSSKTAFVASNNFREQCVSIPSISNKNYNKKKRFLLKCYRCGLRGHLKRDCMKEAKQKSEASSTQGSAFVSDAFPLNLHPNDIWIADSGATQHMTMHRNCFSTFENFQYPQSVLIGNGQSMKASGRGNIDVEMHVGGKWVRNYLQDVWFVPEAKKNLLSILL
ncbi:hypothetical protein JTB14_012848 [Gonioctena quinquepunctata]|nr:hypothetical protein JTB14_012848 [Gonioctena quinquepunctata]